MPFFTRINLWHSVAEDLIFCPVHPSVHQGCTGSRTLLSGRIWIHAGSWHVRSSWIQIRTGSRYIGCARISIIWILIWIWCILTVHLCLCMHPETYWIVLPIGNIKILCRCFFLDNSKSRGLYGYLKGIWHIFMKLTSVCRFLVKMINL